MVSDYFSRCLLFRDIFAKQSQSLWYCSNRNNDINIVMCSETALRSLQLVRAQSGPQGYPEQ